MVSVSVTIVSRMDLNSLRLGCDRDLLVGDEIVGLVIESNPEVPPSRLKRGLEPQSDRIKSKRQT
jgi:hypothetical protein